MSGLHDALIKSVAQGNDGELQKGFNYKLKYGLASSFLALGFTLYYLWAGDQVLALSFLIVSVFLPIYSAGSVVTSYLRGKQLFPRVFFIETAVTIVSVAVMIATLFVTTYVPYLILAFFIPATVLNLGFFYWVARFQTNRRISPDTLRFSQHLTVMNVIGGVTKRLDQLLLFHLIGAVELAIYKFALLPIQKLQGLPGVALNLALPRYAQRSYKEIYEKIGNKLFVTTILSVAIVILYILIVPFLFKIFFPVYMESVKYTMLLALPFALTACSFIHQIWIAKAETKRLYAIKLISDFSKVGLFIVFVPLFGIMGAVWTRIAVSVLVSVVIVILFLKDRKKYIT